MLTAMKKLIFCFISLTFSLYVNSQSMPQLLGLPPYEYEGSEVIEIKFQTTPEAIKNLVPYPLIPDPNNTVIVQMGIQRVNPNYYYDEMIIKVPVKFYDKSGNYHVVLFLEDIVPVVAGREIWGYPKVDADLEFKKKRGKVHAKVARNGTLLFDFSAKIKESDPETYEFDEIYDFAIKEIPSADGNAIPALKRLNSSNIRKLKVYDLQSCEIIKFELIGSEQNFMPQIPVVKTISANIGKFDAILDYGKIEYDYLLHSITEK